MLHAKNLTEFAPLEINDEEARLAAELGEGGSVLLGEETTTKGVRGIYSGRQPVPFDRLTLPVHAQTHGGGGSSGGSGGAEDQRRATGRNLYHGCRCVGGEVEEMLVTCTTDLGVLRRTGFVRRNRFLVLVLRAPKLRAAPASSWPSGPTLGAARQPTGGSAYGLVSQATSSVKVLAL